MNASVLKFRPILGAVSLIIGLLAVNLALFGWSDPEGFSYILGEYARYVCALGGFTATIFGAMLIKDFFVLRALIASKRNNRRNETAWLMRARTEWQLAEDLWKPYSMEHSLDSIIKTEEAL
jgi:hypothetical protein